VRRSAVLLAVTLALAGCSEDDEAQAPTAPSRETGTTATSAVDLGSLAELPVPRTEVSGVAWRGRLAVGGGLTPDGGASDQFHLWSPSGNRWVAGPRLPKPLHHSAMAVVAERLFVVGGYTNGPGEAWVPQALVASLGDGEAAWRDEPAMPSPRGAHAAAVAHGVLVVTGGESGGTPLATTSIYDPGARTWRPGPALARPREHLAAASAGGRVYAIAGRTGTEGNFTVVESLDPAADRAWRSEPELARSRGGIGADAVDGTVCVAGGEEAAGTIAPVECLRDGRWAAVADLARPRHGLAVMALDGSLHVVGGGDQPGLTVSGVHEAIEP
jgi:hypothetical protein